VGAPHEPRAQNPDSHPTAPCGPPLLTSTTLVFDELAHTGVGIGNHFVDDVKRWQRFTLALNLDRDWTVEVDGVHCGEDLRAIDLAGPNGREVSDTGSTDLVSAVDVPDDIGGREDSVFYSDTATEDHVC
jgi:hypothetical protein